MKVKLEFQYFDECPNHKKMYENLLDAIKDIADKIELNIILVNDQLKAKQFGFRGSPTLLIDSEDLEGLPELASPNLACRFYINGIPSSDEIRKK